MIKKIFNIISTIFIIIICLLAISLMVLKLSGYTSFSVLSASMTPKYKVGDLVYTKPVSYEQVKLGDVIVYKANNGALRVMHRVVEKNDAKKEIYTKGDANQTKDAKAVLSQNIVGKVKIKIPKLGLVGMYFSTSSGKICGMILVFLIIILFIIPDLFNKKSKDIQ